MDLGKFLTVISAAVALSPLLLACDGGEQPRVEPKGVPPIESKDDNGEVPAQAAPSDGGLTPVERDALLAEAREQTKTLKTSLESRLMAAMKDGGPPAAVAACNVDAEKITSEAGGEGWTVGRTALRLRNPKNAPDDWERSTLEHFASKILHGQDPMSLEAHVIDQDGQRFRYMKAIPTGAPCLLCHGKEVDPKLVAQLEELYPEDAARGFGPGELRGAFTLEKKLEK
jgi:hypothetical protein